MPTQRIFCNDTVSPAEARYMESFEKRHSNHTLSQAIAGGWAGVGRFFGACGWMGVWGMGMPAACLAFHATL